MNCLQRNKTPDPPEDMCCVEDRGRERLKASSSSGSLIEEEYRICVLGARGVGKTGVCQIYVAGKEAGVNCDHLVVQKTAKYQRAEYCTWDTVDGNTCCMRLSELRMPPQSTDEDYDDPILQSISRSADGFLMIYSVVDTDSFRAAPNYYSLILEIRGQEETPLVFIGNKKDLSDQRVVTSAEGRDTAFDLGSSFYETSIKQEPYNVSHVFHDVIRQARSVRMSRSQRDQPCTRVRGLINRLSLKNKRRRSKSRSKQKLLTTSRDELDDSKS